MSSMISKEQFYYNLMMASFEPAIKRIEEQVLESFGYPRNLSLEEKMTTRFAISFEMAKREAEMARWN